ncbi:hypothetical protein [uncultured Draconibacterium sp.]|uniref:hypothetical protein n=1 Tax=uncultured Draconibacterium sp. TaxID=1573823 RepID=UPI0029C9B1D2|nr:hypothetical protein [uncultured Draconibacterium sp.]
MSRRRLLVVIVPGGIIFSIFFWFILKENKCERLLAEDDCLTQKVFCYYSKQHMLGNGTQAVSTGFYLNYKDQKYKITTKRFWKPIPVGTLIMVRFSPNCPDCAEILWDSVVRHDDYKIRYKQKGEEGYVFEKVKSTNKNKAKLQLLTKVICNGGFSG